MSSGRIANHNTAAMSLKRIFPPEVVQVITRNIRDSYYQDLQTPLRERAVRSNTLNMSLRRLNKFPREVVHLISRTLKADYIYRKAQRILKSFLWSARLGWLASPGNYRLPLRMHSERQMTQFARSTDVFHLTNEFDNATRVEFDDSD